MLDMNTLPFARRLASLMHLLVFGTKISERHHKLTGGSAEGVDL
jgi:hypothetical protein